MSKANKLRNDRLDETRYSLFPPKDVWGLLLALALNAKYKASSGLTLKSHAIDTSCQRICH